MLPFEEFHNQSCEFWAFIRFITENLGYTNRGEKIAKEYTNKEIQSLCSKYHVNTTDELINYAVQYSHLRADLLNNFVEAMLMDANQANAEYLNWEQLHRLSNYACKIPWNKQKGEMRQVAFFTAIINIIAEKTIQELTGVSDKLGFDDDPRSLSYIWDEERHIIGATSRRFDGAYPNTESPQLVWEIKEYYYNKTFGSRIADGVYETQLDGFEFNEIYNRTGRKVYHVLFIDAYHTWWELGKSYLCRIIDALNSGVVDEVIVGREVLTRWPELLKEIITNT
jgi:hypothetical protein